VVVMLTRFGVLRASSMVVVDARLTRRSQNSFMPATVVVVDVLGSTSVSAWLAGAAAAAAASSGAVVAAIAEPCSWAGEVVVLLALSRGKAAMGGASLPLSTFKVGATGAMGGAAKVLL